MPGVEEPPQKQNKWPEFRKKDRWKWGGRCFRHNVVIAILWVSLSITISPGMGFVTSYNGRCLSKTTVSHLCQIVNTRGASGQNGGAGHQRSGNKRPAFLYMDFGAGGTQWFESQKEKGAILMHRTLGWWDKFVGDHLTRDKYNLSAEKLGGPKSVTDTAEWQRLKIHASTIKKLHLRDLMKNERRCSQLTAEFEGSFLDYSRMQVTQRTMVLLSALAKRQRVEEKIAAMYRGDPINMTERRPVLHTALRSTLDDKPIIVSGENVIEQVHEVLQRVRRFSELVRSGAKRGATGKHFRNIVAVGIGGSYLGPEFVHEAFTTEVTSHAESTFYRLRFLSNVDPVDVRRTLYDLDPQETIVIIISKTFTTAETMLNARTTRQWLWDAMGHEPRVVAQHMAACTSISSLGLVEEFGIEREQVFEFWDWVGGRYSVCSSVGALPLSLKYGYSTFEKFLAGARSIDKHFLNAPMERNIPLIMGMLSVWNISFMGYRARTVLPYAEALLKLPAYIQQLSMESNGKHVTVQGDELDYDVGQIDFGEPGTNGQHSFFQLLHMGQICPAEFIGFIESQHHLHVEGEPIPSHDELMANFFAQPDALAFGKQPQELRKEGCEVPLYYLITYCVIVAVQG